MTSGKRNNTLNIEKTIVEVLETAKKYYLLLDTSAIEARLVFRGIVLERPTLCNYLSRMSQNREIVRRTIRNCRYHLFYSLPASHGNNSGNGGP